MSESFGGDQSRQATAAIRGYDYQLWWSLYSWCTLAPREHLYLEHAEDFAVVEEASAEIVQVKDTSRTLTLVSEDAVSAIRHWWEHQERNADRAVHLRFLTTASVGIERDGPFGDEAGVLYWKRAKRMGVPLGALRTYLLGRELLPLSLRAFVMDASDEDLRQKVVQRISWDYASPPREDVRVLVEEAIAEMCVPHYTQFVDDARRIAPTLKDRLLEAILKPALQPLTYVRLLEGIADLLTERRPRSEIRALERVAAAVADSVTGPSESIVPSVESSPEAIARADTSLPTGYLVRGATVSTLIATLAGTGVLVIRGSSGMGKSRLALLVMRSVGGEWLLLDARGRSPVEVRSLLERATASMARAKVAGVLIDDLNFDEDPQIYENGLIRFLRGCRRANWNVIVTTHLQLSERVSAECEVRPEAAVTAPPFGEEDVRELAELHGCSPGLQSERWAKVIHATTQGHPLLIHARVIRLKAEGWPESAESVLRLLTSTEDLASVQKEARRRLEDELPSAASRSLVYRLAVFTAYFTRRQALLVAKGDNPGEQFDRLVGPWIEGPTGRYYRLSPLLRGSAQEIMADPQVAEVRRDICRAIMATRALTQIDFAELAFQAFFVGYHDGLAAAASASFKLPPKHERAFLGNLTWLPPLKLEPGDSLFPANPVTALLLRYLQFKVARAADGNVARILDAWDREVAALPSGVEEIGMVQRLIFLSDVLFHPEPALEPPRLIRYGNELLRIAREHPTLMPATTSGRDDSRQFHFAGRVVDSVIFRLRGPEQVTTFLQALDSMPVTETQTFIEELRQNVGSSINVMMALLPEETLAEGAARSLEEPIALAAEFGKCHAIPGLRAAAVRTRAVVAAEYLNNPTSALALLDAAITELGEEPPFIADYRATVLAALGNDAMALRIWRELLPHWGGADSTRVFSARQAGIAASRLGEHREAERFFAQAEALARREGHDVLAVGLAAERALAFWRAADTAQAIACLARVLTELATLPDPESDLRTHNLHKLVGHSILWMHHETRGSEFSRVSWITEPAPGRLSQARVDDSMRQLPLAPVAWAWGMLAALEIETDSGEVVQKEWDSRRVSGANAFQSQIEASLVRKALRDPSLQRLFEHAARLYDLMLEFRATEEQGEADSGSKLMGSKGDLIATVVAAAVVIRIAEGASFQSLPVDDWRQEAARLSPRSMALEKLLDVVRELSDGADPTHIAQGAENASSVRMVAATLLVRMARNPDELFLGSALLVTGYHRKLWSTAVEDPVAALVISSWKTLLGEQRFALRSPALVCPAIEAVLADSTSSGFVVSARVVLAAQLGVTVSLSPDFVATLEAVAVDGGSTGSGTASALPAG